MSFKSKIDYCGLADGTTGILKSHDENRSVNTVTCENDEGDTVDATQVGHVIAPSNTYALKADVSGLSIVLGGVNTVNLGTAQSPDNHYFALKSVTIGTSNSGEVSLSATAEEVASASPQRTYTVTIASLKQRNKAQILNSLFTLTGTNCHLQSANYTLSVNIQQTTVDGSRITFDVYGGKIVCSATAKQAGTAVPVIAAGSDSTFVTILSGDNSERRPDSDYASVSAEVTKYLTADAESANATPGT